MANQTDPTGESGTTDSSSTDPRDFVNSTINDTWSLAEIQAIVMGVLRSIFPREFLKNPRTWVIGTVIGYVVDTFIFPVFRGIAIAGLAIIDAITVVFLGRDRVLAPVGDIGLADAPLWIIFQVLGGVAPISSGMLQFIADVNAEIAVLASQAGVGAPVLATALYGAVMLTTVYVLWSIIQVIDVPLIELSGLLRVITLPLKKLIGVFR